MASPEDFQKYHDIDALPEYKFIGEVLRDSGVITEEQLGKFNDILKARAIDEYKEYQEELKDSLNEYRALPYLKRLFTNPTEVYLARAERRTGTAE